ncbi:FimV/HubP family polar landmark protein [Pseudomonas sp. SCB32]|uniref:FimV/HubP family polar landmark protein n=1 Tax=Pseudomonas sp. SCB32 TaxID=2653853 RepID=UPI002115890D|nr:FimV/HubP family polar landmark protein [Pseudomonas sp. SCB32]
MHSSLNQPLDAEIALLQTGDMTSDELIARLASPAAFEQAGVDRFMFLQNLRFTPVIRGGRSYIKVVSTQPVHEPYLNFLVEVERPNGRMLREYTVLLDPPSYNSARTSVAASVPLPDRTAPEPSGRRTSPVRSAPAAPPIPAGEGRYTTVRSDTLWGIASRLGGTGASHRQLMDSLLALNPQAFVNGDPHRLKVGQTLVLPQGQQYAGHTNAPVPQPAAAAPATNTAAPTAQDAAPANAAPSVAPAADAAAVAAPVAPATPTVDGNLAKAEADLALSNAQRDQLNQRMDAMQKQLESLQKALESRDQQVQSLQAELAHRDAPATPATPAAPAAPKAEQSAPAPAPVAAVPATPAVDAAGSSFNVWPWLGVGGLGTLLAGLLLMRRKREEPPVKDTRIQPAQSKPIPQARPVAAAVVPPAPASVPRPQPVLAPDAGVARLPAASADSLEGADIYIAYGRFNQARDLLRKAVAQEPERRELRMKLLLVFAELGDVAGFHEQERELMAQGGDQKQIDQIKSRYPAMLERAQDVPSAPTGETLTDWDDLSLDDTPAPAAHAHAAEAEPDFALNLNDMSLDLDWDSLDPFETPQRSKNAPVAEQPVPADFRSNLRELPEITELDLDGEHASMFAQATESDLVFELPETDVHEHDELLASLDEARACIDKGNLEEAYRILKQVIENGDSKAKAEARELLALIA